MDTNNTMQNKHTVKANGKKRGTKVRFVDSVDTIDAVASDGTEYVINLRWVKNA